MKGVCSADSTFDFNLNTVKLWNWSAHINQQKETKQRDMLFTLNCLTCTRVMLVFSKLRKHPDSLTVYPDMEPQRLLALSHRQYNSLGWRNVYVRHPYFPILFMNCNHFTNHKLTFLGIITSVDPSNVWTHIRQIHTHAQGDNERTDKLKIQTIGSIALWPIISSEGGRILNPNPRKNKEKT